MIDKTKQVALDYISKTIIRIVSEETEISYQLMVDRTREREIVQARHLAMSFIKQHNTISLSQIGKIFGGRDHSTIIHAIDIVQDLRLNRYYNELYLKIEERVNKELNLVISKAKLMDEIKRINTIRKYNHIPSYELAKNLLMGNYV